MTEHVTDTLRDRIAEALLVHNTYTVYDSDMTKVTCDCGWVGDTDYCAEQERHVADAILAIPGSAVVELPEPDPVPTDEDDGKPPLARWGAESGADFQTSVWHFGEVQIDQYASGGWWEALEPISAANARRFAAALLAAADFAERDQ